VPCEGSPCITSTLDPYDGRHVGCAFRFRDATGAVVAGGGWRGDRDLVGDLLEEIEESWEGNDFKVDTDKAGTPYAAV
jgi:hypothetical protein